ncbi:MAG TPA: polysaccharide deacetylase family protein [Longimicrobiales bacterium]|nr:polysaccharide deacetylase family protein [Longimicrobiales bacterium]
MIRSVVHRLRRRIDRVVHPGGRGVVLLYHRVADDDSDPFGLCIAPERFADHVRIVQEVGRPVTLDTFAAGLGDGSLPDRAVAITFDDGYIDNREEAEPILAELGVPGLVFVTTGPGGREREFWWDELERVLLQPGELPATLEVQVAGRVLTWELGNDRLYTDAHSSRQRGWRLLDAEQPTRRHVAFRELYSLLQPLDAVERTRALDSLLAWAGDRAGTIRAARRAMQPAEVAALAAGGTMAVGAHTTHHPALPSLTPAAQHTEIAASKRELEAWTGGPVTGFAYPYGLHDAASVAAAREAGFSYACSGVYAPARPGIDPFTIPRIETPAVDGAALRDILRWQFA